jgi:MraZ protein
LRILNEGVRFVKLDASGRLQIPKELKELGGLSKEVVIQALANKMEIWDKNLRELHKKSVSTADKKKALAYLKSIK